MQDTPPESEEPFNGVGRTSSLAIMGVQVEPMTGIEPAYSAWEADVLPLNYIGAGHNGYVG